jgi:ribulose-phosphate 3-epimerase
MTGPFICPSILSCPPGSLFDHTKLLMEGGADWIHLDVMDGQFVPPITFGADLARHLSEAGSVPLEAHLMTLTPESHFGPFVKAGCRRVIFHVEATAHAHRLCQELRRLGVESGAAINPGTPVESLIPLLDVLDLALVMTVNPGWGGQELILPALDKVAALRRMAPDLAIQVDGGMDPSTIGQAWEAGATHFVAGSYLMKAPTPREGIEALRIKCLSKS